MTAKHDYLDAFYKHFSTKNDLDVFQTQESSDALGTELGNGFLYCSPGWSIVDHDAEFPTDNNVKIEFQVINDDGEFVHDEVVDFVLTFDLETDVRNYLEIVSAKKSELLNK